MGWFFTKAALLTFGGAYAVLPYVYQGAVEQFQWLAGPQMIDGLALGESAPGPLVESTHGKLGFTAPLTAITAAVVGVIASLALFFIVHIASKQGATGSFLSQIDFSALVLAALALLALLRYKVGVMPVIGACALAGLVLKLMGWI